MEIISIFEKPPQKKQVALALGLFDGIHIGHKALILETVALAKQNGLIPAVFTFHQTDYKGAPTLYPRQATYLQMEKLGIEMIFEAEFKDIAAFSPEAFVDEVLRNIAAPKILLCGDNFRFGAKAAGNTDSLKMLFSKEGEQVVVVPPVLYEGKMVSSSAIREALSAGNPGLAHAYLGMPYTLYGNVGYGKAVGRTMHFPTLNLEIPCGFLVPRRGVYVCKAKIDGISYSAIANIGRRPTLENQANDNAEVHLLHTSGDFYGKDVAVELLDFVRQERQFDSIAALAEQIQKDVAYTEDWFKQKA